MLYDTIEIKLMINGEWAVLHQELPYERKEGEQRLNGTLGFFHYPREWGKEKAFEVLQDQMIEGRLKVIAELQNQVDQLRALTL